MTTHNVKMYISDTDDPAPVIFPIFRHREGETECPDCYCAPCVIDEKIRQLWWPTQNRMPKSKNAALRKVLYQKFWAMLHNRGAWKDERYLRKKAATKKSLMYKIEIMPDCVLRQCRQWYPNPDDIPYAGNKWQ